MVSLITWGKTPQTSYVQCAKYSLIKTVLLFSEQFELVGKELVVISGELFACAMSGFGFFAFF